MIYNDEKQEYALCVKSIFPCCFYYSFNQWLAIDFINSFGANKIIMRKPLLVNLVSIATLLIISFLVVTMLTPYGSATSPDSLRYLDIAMNIKNGDGALATNFALENAGRHILNEQRAWPPLYPTLLSITVSDSSDVLAVANISKILLFISAFFVFLILSPLTKWYFALISSCLFSITLPMITIYTYVWSETLFIALMNIAIWISINYLGLDAKYFFKKIIFLASLLIILILLAYTRYIGIVFAVLLPAVYIVSNKTKFDHIIFTVALGVYTSIVGYLLLDNYRVTGSISGIIRSPSDKTIADNLMNSYEVLVTILPSTLPAVISVLMFSLMFFYVTKKLRHGRADIAKEKLINSTGILILVGVVYIFAVVILRSHSLFDEIDVRLLSPGFPALFMLIIIFPLFSDINSKTGISACVLSGLLIASFPIEGYGQLIKSPGNWRKYNNPRHSMRLNRTYNSFTTNISTNMGKKIFSSLVSNNGVIVVDRPLNFKFRTGVNCIQKPKVIDREIFQEINALPEGSLFLVDKNERNPFYSMNIGQELVFQYFDLGTSLAIRIPIKVVAAL